LDVRRNRAAVLASSICAGNLFSGVHRYGCGPGPAGNTRSSFNLSSPTVAYVRSGKDCTPPVYRWANRTPEQILIDREAAMKYLKPARPLPPGTTFFEVVQGTWPGDETDEEVNRALEALS